MKTENSKPVESIVNTNKIEQKKKQFFLVHPPEDELSDITLEDFEKNLLLHINR